MDNYEYIIASLPDIARDPLPASVDIEDTISQIRSQLSGKDNETLDFLLKGFKAEELNADFYLQAGKNPGGFIKAYFNFDRLLRNTRVQWLNTTLSRPEDQDILKLQEDEVIDPDQATLDILQIKDMLEREKALDALVWDKCNELTELHIFDLDIILAFTVKLKLCERWLALDPEEGKAMLKKMVEEIRKTKQ